MGNIAKKIAKRESVILVFVIFVGLLLRLINIDQSLWLDEAIGALAARDYTYSGILDEFIKFDNHPPFYYIALKFWINLFGQSEIAIRSLSLVFGILTIYLTYQIARLFDEVKKSVFGFSFPFLVAFLMSISQFAVYFSQEARMYQMAAFFAACVFYFFLLALKNDKKIYWFLFSLSSIVLLYTDYLPIFFLPVPFLILLFYKSKYKLLIKPYLISLAPVFFVGLLWLPTFFEQVKNYQYLLSDFSQWKSVAGGISPKEISLLWVKIIGGRISFYPKSLYYGLVIAVSIPVFYVILRGALRKSLIPVYLWIVTPVLLCILASFFFPAFNYFRFVFILPAVFILIAYGIVNLKNQKIAQICFLTICVFFLIQNGIYIFDSRQQRENWREVVKYVEKERDYHKLAIFSFPEPFAPYRWYSKGLIRSVGGINKLGFDLQATKKKVENAIAGKDTVYYFEYLHELTDPNKVIEQIIIHNGYSVASRKDFVGVGIVTTYEKK
ncbi:MAG: glycosyltransferase family 39 protein [Patescibacteria group bacterium]|nr:glycosyltransferase family 39 protein [Patescibacteria group bacterium]